MISGTDLGCQKLHLHIWKPNLDIKIERLQRRELLSMAASLFDPLGDDNAICDTNSKPSSSSHKTKQEMGRTSTSRISY